MTKSKSAPLSTSIHIPASLQQSSSIASTWPVIDHPIQSTGIPTSSYPTSGSYPNSESSVCLPSAPSSQSIDPELESLLSELECPNDPLSRCGSYDSVCRRGSYESCPGCSSNTPPLSTLDAQVYLAEQTFSPHSDYSDELDSAYCSPVDSTRVSYNCSPKSQNHGCAMPDWSSSDWLPPVSSSCLQEVACEWSAVATSPRAVSSASSVVSLYDSDQGPPMTPTVSQLLEQYNPY